MLYERQAQLFGRDNTELGPAAEVRRVCARGRRYPEPAHDDSEAICARDLTVAFGSSVALDRVTVQIPARRLSAIVGPPGSGKTTLLKALSCELPWGSGSVLIQEVPARLWPEKKRAACLFTSPPRDCADCTFQSMGECRVPDYDAAVVDALELLGLRHLQRRACSSLSPRDAARVQLARTIAPLLDGASDAESVHLWLDDPLDGLDSLHAHRLMQWLQETAGHRQSTVVTLADHALARLYAEHAILLRAGVVISSGPPECALAAPRLTRAFGE